jgi:hypothetical protein
VAAKAATKRNGLLCHGSRHEDASEWPNAENVWKFSLGTVAEGWTRLRDVWCESLCIDLP